MREREARALTFSLSLSSHIPPAALAHNHKNAAGPARALKSLLGGQPPLLLLRHNLCLFSFSFYIYMSLYSIFLCLFGKKERKFFLFFFLSPSSASINFLNKCIFIQIFPSDFGRGRRHVFLGLWRLERGGLFFSLSLM